MNPGAWTPEQRAALQTLVDSRQGAALREAFTHELAVVSKQLIMNDTPEQVRRLQGEARAITKLIDLLTPSIPNTASKG